MGLCSSLWIVIGPLYVLKCHYALLWVHMVPYRSLCVLIHSNGFLQVLAGLYASLWIFIVSFVSLWILMGSYGSF